MKKTRIGNSFQFLWELHENGQAIDLSLTTERKLILKSQTGSVDISDKLLITDISYIQVHFDAANFPRTGIYNVEFNCKYIGEETTIDVDLVEIVPKSELSDEVEDIVMTSDLLIGLRGADAYEVWQSQAGNIGDTYYSLILTPLSTSVPYFSSKSSNTVTVTCAGGFDFILIRSK